MADTKNFPPWTPKDELILAEQDVTFLDKLILRTGTTQELQEKLKIALDEVAKWQAIVNGK